MHKTNKQQNQQTKIKQGNKTPQPFNSLTSVL